MNIHLLKLFNSTNNCKIISRNTGHGQWKSQPKVKLENVIHEAEKAVGYPTSFLSLRWILNDEIANVATHIRKLIGTNHPLLKTAKDLLFRNEVPTWGLIVLLVSKAAGLNPNFTELECDRTADILHSQRILAEVVEMVKTSHLIHNGLINIEPNTLNSSDLLFGNKLALLCGDYLLASSFNEVAKLRNSEVQIMISSTLRDLSTSEFLEPRNIKNHLLPCKPEPIQKLIEIPLNFKAEPLKFTEIRGHMKSEWMFRNILSGGSLLSYFCKASLILGNHSENVQNLGFEFGRNFVLACQASLEHRWIMNDKFSLVSAPVMLHLEDYPDFYNEIEAVSDSDVDELDYDFLRNCILEGPGLKKTAILQKELAKNCLEILDKFNHSESKSALVKIVESL